MSRRQTKVDSELQKRTGRRRSAAAGWGPADPAFAFKADETGRGYPPPKALREGTSRLCISCLTEPVRSKQALRCEKCYRRARSRIERASRAKKEAYDAAASPTDRSEE